MTTILLYNEFLSNPEHDLDDLLRCLGLLRCRDLGRDLGRLLLGLGLCNGGLLLGLGQRLLLELGVLVGEANGGGGG